MKVFLKKNDKELNDLNFKSAVKNEQKNKFLMKLKLKSNKGKKEIFMDYQKKEFRNKF